MPYSLETLNGLAWRNFGLSLQGAAQVAAGLPGRELNGITQQLYAKDSYAALRSGELVTLLGGNAASLPGITGSYWETPDHASLDITADLDLRFEIGDMFGATNVNRSILSKWPGGASNLGYEHRYNGFGFEEFVWSPTGGTTTLTDTSAIFSGGSNMIGRFTIDVVNGSDRVLTWYLAGVTPGLGAPDFVTGPWIVRQQKTVAGNTSINANTAPLRIGARADGTGTNAFNGRISRVQLRNGIDGTIVANPDFRFLAPGTTSFNDSTGKTWTRAGTASIA